MKTFTKFFTLVCAFTLLISFSSYAQHYPNPNGSSGHPLIEIWIYGIGGSVTPAIGDSVAVFDGGKCVGTMELTKVPSLDNVWDCKLIAYSKKTNGDDLYQPGNPMLIKFWDVSANTEYYAYTWGDGNQIDFHNTWYAPTSDDATTATTYGAFFPAEGAYSYCYVDLDFGTASPTFDVDITISVEDVAGAPISGATVTAGGSLAVEGAAGDYADTLYAGSADDVYYYTYEISKTGYTTETLDVEVKNSGSPYAKTVILDGEGNISGIVKLYRIEQGDYDSLAHGATVSTTISGTTYSGGTNTSGVFLIEDIPDGTWDFIVTYPNFINDTLFNQVIPKDGTTLDISGTPVQLDPKQGTIYGEIMQATSLRKIVGDTIRVSLYKGGVLKASDTTWNGEYSLSYYGDTYDSIFVQDITTVPPGTKKYQDHTQLDYTIYPGQSVELNFNLLPIGYTPNYPTITGNPNTIWSIHIEAAKFGYNYLIPFDELVIFNIDSAGSPNVIGSEPGIRVGTLQLQKSAEWQNSGSNVLKAYGQLNSGKVNWAAGDSCQIWAYDISHDAVYERPLLWYVNGGVGNHSSYLFPDPAAGAITYYSLTWETVPGQLAGNVDSAGTATKVEGVHVQVWNVFSGVVVGEDTTDANGDYQIEPLDQGTYDVTFSHMNYESIEREDVEIFQEQITHLDTSLVARNEVTIDYDFNAQGYYFISRCVEQPGDTMIQLLDTNGVPGLFSAIRTSSWVANDKFVGAASTDTLKFDVSWIPDPYLWDSLEGYQLYLEDVYEFDMTGYLLKPEEHPISFASAGFYYVPYFPYDNTSTDDALTALGTILDNLDWAMDSDGNRLHKDNGSWVDNIGTLDPSEGLKLKMLGADILTYPASAKKSGFYKSTMLDPVHFVYSGGNAADWTFAMYIETEDFDIGDEIAAYSNGVMVGSMVIDSEDPWYNNLNTFYKAVNGGYGVNTPIEFIAWDMSENQEYNVTHEMIDINDQCYYGENYPGGLDMFSYVEITRGTVKIDENERNIPEVALYPNPVTGLLNIQSENTIENIRIYSVYGSLVSNTSIQGTNTQIDISDFSNGMYFIQVQTTNGFVTKQIIKQ